MPEATTSGLGGRSKPVQCRVITEARVCGTFAEIVATGGVRSIVRAAASAAPASMIPTEVGVPSAPGSRWAVDSMMSMISLGSSDGFSARISAASPETCGAAIDVPWR